MSLNGVVIAGGKSSRMGEDKALLPFGEYSTLAEFQYRKLESILDRVYISTKSSKFPFNANLIFDKYSSFNPLNAIVSSLEYIKDDTLLLSVDIPFISKQTIDSLIDSYNRNPEYQIYVAKSNNGIEPTVAIYKIDILEEAKRVYSKENFRLKEFIKSFKYYEVDIPRSEEFLNINTKKEYKKGLKKV